VAEQATPASVEHLEKHPLDEEANTRLEDCRRQKSPFEIDMRECYFFTAPLRARIINSNSQIPDTPLHDDGYLQTSAAYEVTQDFVTEIINTFMPQAEQWCERKPGIFTIPGQWDKIKQQVQKDDTKIFEAIKSSNFYAEMAKAAYPDLAIGTMGLWIDDPRPAENIVCQAIPLRELEINLGPYGEIDDRFIVRHTRNRYLKALLGPLAEKLPPDIKRKTEEAGNQRTQIRWGYWRQWDKRGDECWQHVVMVGRRVIHSADLVGEGCCPLIVARFNPTADWAYALGPLLQGLPEFRQVDELEGQKIAHIELNLTPPTSFPDDSFAAIEQGLEPGMAYPIRVGSQDAIKKIYDPGSPEAGIYEIDKKIQKLRKMFYVDYPEQKGDTPPTLGQYMDELARSQRRIGTPGLPFWLEGPAKIFLRFKYMLEVHGVIQPVKVEGKTVSLQPYNPAQRAAEQQEIATTVRNIQILGQAFPEEFKAFIDGKATMKALLEKTRDTLLKMRADDQVEKAVGMIQQLLSPRAVPGGTPQPAQGVQ
jgi:hypothetical protein